MHLSTLDWAIILGYLVFALGVGIYYSRRAGKNPEEYYLAGRSLPWWVLGTSMVATTFAADTPLLVTELTRDKGIWENWIWWNMLLYGMLSVFLFSRLWRRANVLTENELLELRYSGKPAALLRFFKAGYFSLLFNFIVMGWVINAMSDVVGILLGDSSEQYQIYIVAGLAVIAVIYSLLSGFWGVVVTDVVQFVIAMIGSIALAIIAVQHVGGVESLLTKLDDSLAAQKQVLSQELMAAEAELPNLSDQGDVPNVATDLEGLRLRLAHLPENAEQAISVIPRPTPGVPVFSKEFLNTPFFNFLVLMTVMWWSNHATDGGGYLIQRTMAAKNEQHALGANLWYNFALLAVRTWPWVIVALVSVVLFPDLRSHELGEKAGYPEVMRTVLGSGMRGLLAVSFLAAFMSTIDTHLNWGSSYIVHDIYRRFVAPQESDGHYVTVGKFVTVALMAAAAILSTYMGSIEKAWKFVMAMGGGIGLVLILRWFWWRINAWTEIVALATSVLVTISFELLARSQTIAKGEPYELFSQDPEFLGMVFPFHLQLLVVVACSIVAWVVATYVTRPEPEETLLQFYSRVQPGGWWGDIAKQVPRTKTPVVQGFVFNFVAGLTFVWGGMFAIGYAIFQIWNWSLIMALLSVVGFAWIYFRCLTIEN